LSGFGCSFGPATAFADQRHQIDQGYPDDNLSASTPAYDMYMWRRMVLRVDHEPDETKPGYLAHCPRASNKYKPNAWVLQAGTTDDMLGGQCPAKQRRWSENARSLTMSGF